MASDGALDLIGQGINISGTANTLATIGTWLVFLTVILGSLYALYYIMSFKHTLIVRDIVNGRKIVTKYKWKEAKDKKKNTWLMTTFGKIKKPLPPSKAIELTPKGKKFVEAWRGEDNDTLIWVNDDFDLETYKETLGDAFQPLTTQDRALLAEEIVDSHKYRQTSNLDRLVQVGMTLAPVIMIIVIAVVLGDITSALGEYANAVTEPMNTIAESLREASANFGSVQNAPTNLPTEAPN